MLLNSFKRTLLLNIGTGDKNKLKDAINLCNKLLIEANAHHFMVQQNMESVAIVSRHTHSTHREVAGFYQQYELNSHLI